MNLEEISKQYGISIDELKQVEEKFKRKYAGVANIMSKETLEKYVSNGVMGHVNKMKNLGLDQFFGVVLTLSQPRDGIAKRRNAAREAYLNDPNGAISAGLVEEYKNGTKSYLSKGIVTVKPVTEKDIPKTAIIISINPKVEIVPLDNKDTWPNGKKNFGYLKPLPLTNWFSVMEGIVSQDGQTWMPFRMMFNCSEHINIPAITVPMSKLVKFSAKIKSKENNGLVLSYNSKYTKFEPVEGDINQLNAEIMTFYDNITLSEIENVYRTQEPNETIAVLGRVIFKRQREPTDDKPYPWMTVQITDTTREEPLKILLHPDVKVDFDEDALVKVWGSLSEGNKWDPDLKTSTEEKEITMFGVGLYSFTNIEVPPEEQKDEDGWDQ